MSRRDTADYEGLGEQEKHPALKDHNSFWTKAKYVAGKALKWGLIIGGGAALVGVGATAFAGLSGPVGWLGSGVLSVLGGLGIGGGVSGIMGSIATTALTYGGVAGLLGGGLLSFSGADEYDEAQKEQKIAKYEQMQARGERTQAMALKREQQYVAMEKQKSSMGLSPNVGFGRSPQGRDVNF